MENINCPYPMVKRQWSPTPELVEHLLNYSSRLYTDHDSPGLRHSLEMWIYEVQTSHPGQLNFDTPQMQRFLEQRKQDCPQGQAVLMDWELDEDVAVSAAVTSRNLLTSPLEMYTFKLRGYPKTSCRPGWGFPYLDIEPLRELPASRWYSRFCQEEAFNQITSTSADWLDMEVWVEIYTRRIDISDAELERRCEAQYHRTCNEPGLTAVQRETLIRQWERHMDQILNGRIDNVLHYPEWDTTYLREWIEAGH